MLYGVAANIIYGVESTGWCPVIGICTSAGVLLLLLVLLYLRRKYGNRPANSKPVFVEQPLSFVGGIGSRVEFRALAEADPVPTYQVSRCSLLTQSATICWQPPVAVAVAVVVVAAAAAVTVAVAAAAALWLRTVVSRRFRCCAQWRRNDEVIVGETRPKLVIASATIADCIARYTCVASNSVGQAVSSPAFVEYEPLKPQILRDLKPSVEVHRGETVTLEVKGALIPTDVWGGGDCSLLQRIPLHFHVVFVVARANICLPPL